MLKKFIIGLFPILRWSKRYHAQSAIGDLIAGITIALTLIPQSMAYAALAGLKPQYGLYASFMAPFIYAFMGTCPQISMGPSALLSLLTFTYTHGTNADFGIFLAFFSGCFQLIAGILRIGSLVDFISAPVVSGFTSAAAFTIASSQVKGLLGLKYSAGTFVRTWSSFFEHVHKIRMYDSLLSVGCCITLVILKACKEIKFNRLGRDERGLKRAETVNGMLWFIGVSRNATVVTVATVTAFIVHKDDHNPLILTGIITPGLPEVRHPPFHTTVGNTTFTTTKMLKHIGPGLGIVPAVGILANIAIAKAFSQGQKVDATQEIIALGVCNIVSSYFQSMLVNGSFSRSAVSNASGVKTPGSGIYTGLLVVLTLLLLTPYFYFIPRAALSSVIVCAVLQMVDVKILKTLWKISRLDIIPLMSTFLSALFMGVEFGLICGVCVDGLLLLYYHSRPPLDIQYVDNGVLPSHYAIHPIGGIHFAGAENMTTKLSHLIHTDTLSDDEEYTPRDKILVVYCDVLYRVDYTFLQSMQMFVVNWSQVGRVIWVDVNDTIKQQLELMLKDAIFCAKKDLGSYMITSVESPPLESPVESDV